MEKKVAFQTKTMTVTIDYSKCLAVIEGTSNPSCGYMCIKSCRQYGRNVLKIDECEPALATRDEESIKRLDNECLACEFSCMVYGSGCINIDIPLAGVK